MGATVRVEVSVPVDQASAYSLFIDRIGDWWPVPPVPSPHPVDPPRAATLDRAPGQEGASVEVRFGSVTEGLTTVIVEEVVPGGQGAPSSVRDRWWTTLAAFATAASGQSS